VKEEGGFGFSEERKRAKTSKLQFVKKKGEQKQRRFDVKGLH